MSESILRRLHRLERAASGECPGCYRVMKWLLKWPGQPAPALERCPICGKEFETTLMEVVYKRPELAKEIS